MLGLTSCGCVMRGAAPGASSATATAEPTVAGAGERYWWYCRFKVSWPPETDPDFAVDLLLAHAVVAPVLLEYQGRIDYWRFHRRAARDKAGHQFSFLFRSDPGTAGDIFRSIERVDLLREALAEDLIEKVSFDNPDNPTRPKIEDTSDASWSPALQRSWPPFIMGVSALWLGLIDEAMVDASGEAGGAREVLEHYRKANARVTAIWYKEGQHAFLHHLNALFGYEPMLLKKEIRF